MPASAAPAKSPLGETAASIDAAAKAAIKAGACPGIAVRVEAGGKTLLDRHYGNANLETDSPVTGRSVFRIGSLTKQFTAALVIKLASQGHLSLDANAADYLPFFASHPPFSLRELLNHTAGLHSDEEDASIAASARSQVDLAQAISKQPKVFDFDPGTAWLYSNANYIVLGAVIEKVTGLPLAKAASQLIFEPLQLTDTAFDSTETVVRGRVDGYSPAPGGYAHPAFIQIAEAGGAGAMRSTAADLCRWHHALFTNQLFAADYVSMMVTPGKLRDGRLSGSNRFSPDDAHYGDTQYGMGLLITPPSGGHRSALHYGFINGFAACLETTLDAGLTVAILCNGDVGPQMPFGPIRRVISKELLPRLVTPAAA